MLRFLVLVLFLSACGGDPPVPSPKPKAVAPKKVEKPVPAKPIATVNVVTDDGKVATIALEGSDAMQFNTTEIKVKAGRKIKLTLTHTGKMPKAAMGHNFVLLAKGIDLATFASSAASAKDTDYVPAGAGGKVIAHTTLVGGGESVTIEFDAPAAGTYTFLCTFPGHYAMMKGKFIVE